MDAALYLSLRDELQQDAARVERNLEEIRRAESFLLRRIHSSKHLSSYRAVLQDLSSDISRAESEHAEFLRLSRFVTRALVTVYAKGPEPSRLAKSLPLPTESAKPASEQAKPQLAAIPPERVTIKTAAPTPVKTPEPAKSNGPMTPAQTESDPIPKPATMPNSQVEPTRPLTKTGIIEFDKDGFPILAPGKKNAAAIASLDTTPNTEPPTVVFDQNGFPLNPPADESLNTIVEVPKPQGWSGPLAKKDA